VAEDAEGPAGPCGRRRRALEACAPIDNRPVRTLYDRGYAKRSRKSCALCKFLALKRRAKSKAKPEHTEIAEAAEGAGESSRADKVPVRK